MYMPNFRSAPPPRIYTSCNVETDLHPISHLGNNPISRNISYQINAFHLKKLKEARGAAILETIFLVAIFSIGLSLVCSGISEKLSILENVSKLVKISAGSPLLILSLILLPKTIISYVDEYKLFREIYNTPQIMI